MSNNEYTKRLENVIKQMLQPLKDIPFNLVIESMTGKKVISFDFAKSDHQKILSLLKQAALNAGKKINKICWYINEQNGFKYFQNIFLSIFR